MSKLTLTAPLISNSFGWQVVSKARKLVESHAVLDWGFDISGTKMLGRVQETGRAHPYRVEVVFAEPDASGNRWLAGKCSCNVASNCLHAAAVALTAAADRSQGGADLVPADDIDFDKAGEPERAEIGGEQNSDQLSGEESNLQQTLKAVRKDHHYPDFAAHWLKRIDAAFYTGESETGAEEGVIYVLGFDRPPYENNLQVEPRIARRLAAGGFGTPRSYNWLQLVGSRARFVQTVDQSIAKLWVSCSSSESNMSAAKPLQPPGDGDVLDLLLARIIATGRAYFYDRLDLPLQLGQPKDGQISWTVHADARQTPQVVLSQADAAIKILRGSSHWYINLNSGEVGPLNLPYSKEAVQALLDAPRVSAKDAEIIYNILREKDQNLPLPHLDVSEEMHSAPPIVKLHLRHEKFSQNRPVTDGSDLKYVDGDNVAILSFDYGFDSTNLSKDWESHRWSNGKKFVVTRRDLPFESAVRERLTSLSLIESGGVRLPLNQSCWRMRNLGPTSWLPFVQEAVPLLKHEGWQIVTDDTFEFQVVEADEQWLVDIDEGAGFWFNLDLGIVVDGERIALLPVITEAIRSADVGLSPASLDKLDIGGKFYARLPDGRQVALPFARVKEMVLCLAEILGQENLLQNGRLQISVPQVIALKNLDHIEQNNWQGAQSASTLAEEIGRFEIVKEIPEPAALRTVLRTYQKEGLGWLDFIATFQMGGILADDMGLGKTVQTLAHIARAKEQGKLENCPCLVLCPTSVLPNWLSEIQRLTPDLTFVALHGADRSSRFDLVKTADVVFTTYPLLIRDAYFLSAVKWHCVILDEAQAIKNATTQAAQAVLQLHCKYRLCLTGTPIENHLGELWSQFNFLMPGLLGTKATFDRIFTAPIEKGGDEERSERLKLLSSRIRPFILRRTKSEVAKDLPPKTEMIKYVEMEGPQRDLYETVRLSMHNHVLDEVKKKGLASCGLIILEALMKLRQACCHPSLVKLAAADGIESSVKLDYLMHMLGELLEEKRQILIFSQFTSMLDLIALELDSRGLAFVQLRGDTKDRVEPVRKFQNGEVAIFLISLKAGGTGLNLTAADTVIHFDPWWNPAVEDQATDRAHRIGQDKPVFVYRLIASGTIEEKMIELQANKRAIADSILGSGDTSSFSDFASRSQIDEKTLEALFAPLPS